MTAGSPVALVETAQEPDHGATGDSNVPKISASKTKKQTPTKVRKPSSSHVLEHPKYSEMIARAISHLKERGGSSRQAILKFIMNKYNVGKEVNMVNARVKVALKAGVKLGNLKQSRGTGASGSFRLADKRKTAASSDKKPGRPRATGAAKGKKPAGTKEAKTAKSPAKVKKAAAGTGKGKVAKSAKKVATKSPSKKGVAKPKAAKTPTKKIPSKASAAKSKAAKASKKSPAKGAAKAAKKPAAGKKAK